MKSYKFGNAVNNYYIANMRKISRQRQNIIQNIKTKEDALEYVKSVKEKIKNAFNIPTEKSPLNHKITKKITTSKYIQENIIFESRPKLPVTANMYLPIGVKNPPVALVLCGHSEFGKAAEPYRIASINLVENGFAALIVDPISQGERDQLHDLDDRRNYRICREHNMLGRKMLLLPAIDNTLEIKGEYFGTWRAYDALRAIDYIKSRDDLDSSRIVVTGNSGGGTLTSFVTALSDDIVAAAPSCYITSFLHNLENELPVDIEQVPPSLAAAGCEMADLILANAPRPTILLAQKQDFFDPRGTSETFEEVQRIYELLGYKDNIEIFVGPTTHGYSIHNREAMYSFLNRKVLNKSDYAYSENGYPEQLLPEEETYCTPKGQVVYESEYRRVDEFISEKAKAVAAARPARTIAELQELFAPIVEPHRVSEAPHYRVLRNIYLRDGGRINRFAVESEPNKVLSVLKVLPNPPVDFSLPEGANARLYLPNLDKLDEVLKVKGNDEYIFTLDVRGMGECTPAGCDLYFDDEERDFFASYEFDYHFASMGLLQNDAYIGGRVRDILSSINLLKRNFKSITLEASYHNCFPALIAALYSPIPLEIKLYDVCDSWLEAATLRISELPQSAMVPNGLSITDLPELIKLLGAKIIK